MIFGSKRKQTAGTQVNSLPQPEGVRSQGPWDRSERDPERTAAYLNFGSILVRPITGMQVQVASQDGTNIAILISIDGSALELRVVAASRHGDDWTESFPLVAKEIRDRGAEPIDRTGVFGPEVFTEFSAKDPDGRDAVQPACFIGVKGPKWLLRATLIGNAALEASADHVLMGVIRDAVIIRGPEARILGEPLPLEVPGEMQESSS